MKHSIIVSKIEVKIVLKELYYSLWVHCNTKYKEDINFLTPCIYSQQRYVDVIALIFFSSPFWSSDYSEVSNKREE